jgi:hypothetical protein
MMNLSEPRPIDTLEDAANCTSCKHLLAAGSKEEADFYYTPDGECICPECYWNACEVCESRLGEIESGNGYICQSCAENAADAMYERMKDGD